MELRQGYKQTEVGVIPEDWEVKPMRMVAPLQRGFDLPTSNLKSGIFPVVYSNGVMNYHAKFMVKAPGVITGRSGTIGNVHFIEKNYWPHNTSLWVTSFFNNDPKYIYYLYVSLKLSKYGTGSGVPTLNRNDVHDVIVTLPTKTEQTAIAKALSDADAWIQSLTQIIAKKRQIKQGAMQMLLNPYENGRLKVGWKIRTISEIADVRSGKRLPLGKLLTSKETSHPYIRIIDMFDGGVNVDDIMYVPDDVYPSIKNYRIFKNDIFISVAGTLGIVGIIPEELDGANLTENANRFTNIQCDKNYLFFVLSSPLIQNIIDAEKTMGAQPKLALTRIRKFKIPLPIDIDTQTSIAKVLSIMNDEITDLETKLAKAQKIKQGMMQNLLTGRIRLI